MKSVRKQSRLAEKINDNLSKRYPDGSALLFYDSGAIALIGKRALYLLNSLPTPLHDDARESNTCQSCRVLSARYRIDSASELGTTAKIAFQNVQGGRMHETANPEQGTMSTFSQLAQETLKDNVISFGFLCRTCGKSVHLHVETHHSSGG